eukprot:EG_transcript_12540
MKVQMRQMGGFIQQSTAVCGACKGQGTVVESGDRCPVCSAEKIVSEMSTVPIKVPAAVRDGTRMAVRGQGHEIPDGPAGDLIVVVQQEPHPVFMRHNDDLILIPKIGLQEALCGVDFTIKHLDGTPLRITTPPGKVVKGGEILAVPKKGMPKTGRQGARGQLLVKFEVDMPDTLSKEALETLQAVLPKGKSPYPSVLPNDKTETVVLAPASMETLHRLNQEMDRTEEQESQQQGQRIQCAQQ